VEELELVRDSVIADSGLQRDGVRISVSLDAFERLRPAVDGVGRLHQTATIAALPGHAGGGDDDVGGASLAGQSDSQAARCDPQS
jgi:hypothetical protein